MFVGHLPAGLLLADAALRGRSAPTRLWWGAAALGSVCPDFDLVWFYLVDGRRALHHEYWTHIPFVWLCLAPLFLWHALGRLFLAAVVSHLVLDTMVGGILWAWPWNNRSFALFSVPALHGWWVWNFLIHWTFLVEITLVVWAVLQLRRRSLS